MSRNVKLDQVMVFGVFDGLHDGHRFFIGEASKLGGCLIVVVARDETVWKFKDRAPRFPLKERMEAIRQAFPSATVIPGDETQGSWNVLTEHEPSTIALGYDQSALKKELSRFFKGRVAVIGPHEDGRLHSRFFV